MLSLKAAAISCCLFFYLALTGQNPVTTQLSVENGLPNNTIYCLLQAKDGHLWAGSDDGLLRYDGIRWTRFTCPGQKSFGVTGVCESSSGLIYCFDFAGDVMSCNGDEMKLIPRSPGGVTNLAVHDSVIYIGGANGVEVYSEATGKVTPLSSLNNRFGAGSIPGANNVQLDHQGWLWCVTKDRVFSYGNGSVKSYTAEIKAGDDQQLHVYQLCIRLGGAWLFGITGDAVYRLEGEVFKRYEFTPLYDLLHGRKITHVEYLDDCFWITTYSGVVRWFPETGLVKIWYEHLALTDVLRDAEGNTWFASMYNGLYRCADLSILRWDPAASEEGKTHVTGSLITGSAFYFVTETGSLHAIAENERMTEVQRSSRSDIQFLRFDSVRNEVLFGSNGVMYACSNNGVTETKVAYASLKDVAVYSGEVYVAGAAGVARFNDRNKNHFTQLPVNVRSRELYIDAESGLLWIATAEGVFALSVKDTSGVVPLLRVLDSCSIIGLFPGPERSMFCLTNSGNIYAVATNGDTRLIFSAVSGVQIRDFVWEDGTFYCATNKGLLCYTESKGTRFFADHIFGIGSNDIQNIQISNGILQLSTGRGLVRLPVDFNRSRGTPLFRIVGLESAGGLSLYKPGVTPQVLPDLMVTVHTAMIGFSSSGDYTIQYRFAGDSLWNSVPVTDGNFVLPALPIGDNVIQVRLLDHFGVISGPFIEVPVFVKTPFTKSWLFYLLCAIVLIGSTIVLAAFRIRSIRRRQAAELRRVKLESDLRNSRQTALAAQMNPHFIFNVLNSIKGYIYENDRAHASQYLDNFSTLVRQVLEMSARPQVRLENEIEVLRSYIELESMLLDGNFTYSIEVSDEIDTHWIRVPSLLIQPFVENAFKHGLRHSTREKHLSIRFSMHEADRVLQVTISDNGVGRKAAGEINRESNRTHQSFAAGATESRIALMNNESGDQIAVRYEDAADGNGTIVYLKIRLSEHE